MKFVLATEHLYWWPVKVRLPDPDPKRAGKVIVQEFQMQFASIPSDEARELAEEIAALPEKEQREREFDLILRVARDWSGVFAQDGELTYSEELLKSMLQIGFYRLAILRAFNESLTGDEARKGN